MRVPTPVLVIGALLGGVQLINVVVLGKLPDDSQGGAYAAGQWSALLVFLVLGGLSAWTLMRRSSEARRHQPATYAPAQNGQPGHASTFAPGRKTFTTTPPAPQPTQQQTPPADPPQE